MKKLYWRPSEYSRIVLALIAIFAVGGLFLVEYFKSKDVQPYLKEKMAAARLAERAMKAVKRERSRLGYPIDVEFDPARSGLIGPYMTRVTSVPGSLPSKQTAANPNFAAVVVHMLKRLKLNQGDVVAVGFSGSFPSLNICVLSAIQTLKLKPIVISSVSGSGFGANIPELLWPDMERVLVKRKIMTIRSEAASLGGINDRAQAMSKKGKGLLKQSIERNDLIFLDTKNYLDGIEQRMKYYEEKAGEQTIKAYINVGGGTLSVGTTVGKHLYHEGINRRPPPGALAIDSVMTRFMKRNIPIIHFINITRLADRYGLPLQPKTMPKPGEGLIFSRNEYNPWLTGFVLFSILAGLVIFIRSAWGQRFVVTATGMKNRQRMERSI